MPNARLFAVLFMLTACGGEPAAPVAALDNPALSGSRYPDLSMTPDGNLRMSWLQPAADDVELVRTAVFDGASWTAPLTAASSATMFVNWADFPRVTEYKRGHLIAHWLENAAADSYGYDIRLALSTDGGQSFSDAITPPSAGPAIERGFVSHFPVGDGVGLVWLTGHDTAGHSSHGNAETLLRYAAYSASGELMDEATIDTRVCDCCQTDTVTLRDRVLVAFRDRSLSEIRDIALAEQRAGAWRSLGVAAADGWRIDGCPVNGPAVAANGNTVALAWYTAAADTPAIRIARSTDRANSFSETTLHLGGEPLGRTDIVVLANAEIVVSWVERAAPDSARLVVRRYGIHGRPGPELEVARLRSDRASGFPRMQRIGDQLLVAWTEASGDDMQVRTALVQLDALARN
ncbi:MAG: hypothetical protein AAFZ58_13510 [Pseudomonadota bacterium]